MDKKVEINRYLLTAHYADTFTELNGQNYGKFIKDIKSFDFKDGDYIVLAEMKYGPNIHVAVQVGYDIFTLNEDGTICNNPETDKRQYYIEVMVLGDNAGPNDKCIETVWLDEEYPNGITEEEAFELYDTMYRCARRFILNEINKLPYVWSVNFEGYDSEGHQAYSALFARYEEAKAFFDENVAVEQNPEISWVGDIWNDYKNDNLEEEDYDIESTEDTFSVTDNNEGYYVSWTLRKKEIF